MAKRDVRARLRDLEITEAEERAALLEVCRGDMQVITKMLTAEEWALLDSLDLGNLAAATPAQRAAMGRFRDLGGVSAAWHMIDFSPDAERDAAYLRTFGVPYSKGLSDNAQRSF